MPQTKEVRRNLLFIIFFGLAFLFSTGLAAPPRFPDGPIVIP